jgi:hypothetical protein
MESALAVRNLEQELQEIIETFFEENIPDPKENPHLVPFYIFAKLYKKYGKNEKISFAEKDGFKYAMFPLFYHFRFLGGSDLKDGWLTLCRRGERSTILSYFTGTQPYLIDKEPFPPVVDIWGGYFKGPGNGTPIMTDDIVWGTPAVALYCNEKHFSIGDADYITPHIDSFSKYISEITEINKLLQLQRK